MTLLLPLLYTSLKVFLILKKIPLSDISTYSFAVSDV